MPQPTPPGATDSSVLIVNDQPAELDLLRVILTQSGYTVHSAVDGVEGLHAAVILEPDVMVSDVQMPRMDGITLCRHIRDHPELSDTPVLLVSAVRKDSASAIEGFQSGADDYLEVPYDPLRLVAKVARLAERRRAHRALRASEEARRRSEARVRLLLDSTAEAILALDLDGRCTLCNRSGLAMLGYETADEVIGQAFHALVHHTRANGTACTTDACALHLALSRGEPAHATDQVLWRRNGAMFPVEYWSFPIRDGAREVGSVITFIDISDRIRLESQLQQAQKLEAVGRLAAGVAHDFNNLLTAIIGFTELTLAQVGLDSEVSADLREVLNAGRSAAALTRQLLVFSRRQTVQPQLLNPNLIVTRLEAFLRRSIGEAVQLRTSLAPNLPFINADGGQIEQVLLNLSLNARDAMPEGGVLTIETLYVVWDAAEAAGHPGASAGPHVVLAISDTGTGMDAVALTHLFEPFYTTKELGHGTGLGLATVYAIVQQSGGTILVDSTPGQGTTFRIYWPASV
ncbi:MAG: response regulator [Vicinamibacterales bacterium]